MIGEYFACPTCKSALKKINNQYLECLVCKCDFPIVDDIPILLPHKLCDFKKMEAEYHTHAADNYAAINMVESLRVRNYHDAFLVPLESMAAGSLIIEVAGGDGTDAMRLLECGMTVVQTDISIGMVSAARTKIVSANDRASSFVVCDAENLPCKDEVLDAVLIVGALHHLPSPGAFFVEAQRVLKTGGILVVGFEPNTWQYTFIYPVLKKIRSLLTFSRTNTPYAVSIGDQETNGFSLKHFKGFAGCSGLEIIEVQRIWYVNGFIHTLLGHYNSRKSPADQVDLPRWIQKLLIFIDDALSKIPIVCNFCWHWSIVLKKVC